MRGVFSNANDFHIPPNEPPLQASSSPMPRVRIRPNISTSRTMFTKKNVLLRCLQQKQKYHVEKKTKNKKK